MEKNADCLRDVNAKHGGRTRKNVPHYVFSCPLGVNCRAGGQFYVEKGAGYTIPLKHLIACMSDGNADHLFKIYDDALDDIRRCGIANWNRFVSESMPATCLDTFGQ